MLFIYTEGQKDRWRFVCKTDTNERTKSEFNFAKDLLVQGDTGCTKGRYV